MPGHEYVASSQLVEDTIADIKNADIIRAGTDHSLYEVINKFITNGISKLLIYDGEMPSGIITDKDVIRFLYNERSGMRFDEIPAGKIMNPICYVTDDMTCKQAAQMMLLNRISSLGIKSDESLTGIITKTDLLQHYVNRQQDESRVLDYMTISYFSAPTDTKLNEIIKKMITCDISRVILTEERAPIGIITNGDIFRMTVSINKMSIVKSSIANYSEEGSLWSKTGFVGSKPAGEAMTEGLATISHDSRMKVAAQMMLEKKIDSLAVCNEKNEMIGIINKTNVLYALANAK